MGQGSRDVKWNLEEEFLLYQGIIGECRRS